MAHEFETGFFVRKPAWHELGIVLQDDPNTDSAFQASGLDWTVRKELLKYQYNGELIDSKAFGVIRETDGQFLGVCKDRYQIFQNKEAFEWCRPLVESGLYKWEAAGSLKQGQTCWALLNSGGREIIKGDTLKSYLLFTWSHDGSKSVCIQPTSIRVVCNNTLTAALRENTKRDKVRHTLSMQPKLEDVRRYYEEAQEAFEIQDQEFKLMLNTELTQDLKQEYVNGVMNIMYNDTDPSSKRSRSIRSNTETGLLRLIDGEASSHKELGIQNTLYGAFQATSEFMEHYASQKGDKDGYSVLFGNRGLQIDGARNLALRLADGKTPFFLKNTSRNLSLATA